MGAAAAEPEPVERRRPGRPLAADRDAIVAMYAEHEMSVIADKLGISEGAVLNALVDRGVPRRPRGAAGPARQATVERVKAERGLLDIDELREHLRCAGAPCSRARTYHYVKAGLIEPERDLGFTKPRLFSKAAADKLIADLDREAHREARRDQHAALYRQGLSLADINARTGYSTITIYNDLTARDEPLRPMGLAAAARRAREQEALITKGLAPIAQAAAIVGVSRWKLESMFEVERRRVGRHRRVQLAVDARAVRDAAPDRCSASVKLAKPLAARKGKRVGRPSKSPLDDEPAIVADILDLSREGNSPEGIAIILSPRYDMHITRKMVRRQLKRAAEGV